MTVEPGDRPILDEEERGVDEQRRAARRMESVARALRFTGRSDGGYEYLEGREDPRDAR